MGYRSAVFDGALYCAGAISLTWLYFEGMRKLSKAFNQLLLKERENQLDLQIALKMGKQNIEKALEYYEEKIQENVKIVKDENIPPSEALNALKALQTDVVIKDYTFELLDKANEQELLDKANEQEQKMYNIWKSNFQRSITAPEATGKVLPL